MREVGAGIEVTEERLNADPFIPTLNVRGTWVDIFRFEGLYQLAELIVR